MKRNGEVLDDLKEKRLKGDDPKSNSLSPSIHPPLSNQSTSESYFKWTETKDSVLFQEGVCLFFLSISLFITIEWVNRNTERRISVGRTCLNASAKAAVATTRTLRPCSLILSSHYGAVRTGQTLQIQREGERMRG